MIVTKDPHMEFVAVDSKGHKQIVYNDETYEHNYPFTFEIPFTNDPVPSTFTPVKIYPAVHPFFIKVFMLLG